MAQDSTQATAQSAKTSATISVAITVAAVTCLVGFALYATMSVLMWRGFISPSWDLGIFTQLAQQYANFQAPIVNIKGEGYNLLGDHFHPILVLLGPIYKLFPSGLTLLLVQAALFAVSAWPVTRYAVERFGVTGGTTLGLSYVFSWALINAVWAQFHEIAFAVPLLAFGLTWWLRGNRIPAAVAIGLLVFVKEDQGLTVLMFGVAVFILNRAHWLWATAFAGWGILWFVLTVQVLLPALNPNGRYDYTDNVSIAETLTQQVDTKVAVVCMLVLAAGVIGLRSPLMLLMLPTLAWRFVGNVEYYWGFDFHYSATLLPIAATAMIHATPRRFVKLAPAVALVSAVAMFAQSQLNLLWKYDQYANPDATAAIQTASKYNTVASDIYLLAYVVPHANTYWFGTIGNVQPDAVIFNVTKSQRSPLDWAQTTYGGTWTTVFDDGTYQVVARG